MLVVLSGLPGSGKSYFGRVLASRLPFVTVETDWVRKNLFRHPSYSAGEHYMVFSVAHCLLAELLGHGYLVIFDATNLRHQARRAVYGIAEKAGAKAILVRLYAPPEVVRERMERRAHPDQPEGLSDAGWEVHLRMAETEETIRESHLEVDTSQPIEPAVEEVLRWVQRAAEG